MLNTYTAYDQLPLVLNADQVSQLLGISRAGAYSLFHIDNFPCIRINIFQQCDDKSGCLVLKLINITPLIIMNKAMQKKAEY